MTEAAGPEIWFYHLERSSLEQVLPELLDRTLKRGWRALVKVADAHRLEDVDEGLWMWRDESFLAHGRADQPHAERLGEVDETRLVGNGKQRALGSDAIGMAGHGLFSAGGGNGAAIA